MSTVAQDLKLLRQQAKLPANKAGGNTVQAFFEANRSTLRAVLPKHLNPDRMLKIALGALRTTPKLTECSVESLFGAVVVCSQLGLEPNTPMGQVHLIPYTNRRKGITEVQVIPGYKGLIDLARRSGMIENISARIVYENDEFTVDYGTEERIVHKPVIFGESGRPIGAYASAKIKEGGYQFEFMSVEQINAIRDSSQGYQMATRTKRDTPWTTFWDEMAKKTVIRRLCKYLPMSIEIATAVALDEKHAIGQGQSLETALQGEYTVLADAEEDDTPPETALKSVDTDTGEYTPDLSEVLDLIREAGPEDAEDVAAVIGKLPEKDRKVAEKTWADKPKPGAPG